MFFSMSLTALVFFGSFAITELLCKLIARQHDCSFFLSHGTEWRVLVSGEEVEELTSCHRIRTYTQGTLYSGHVCCEELAFGKTFDYNEVPVGVLILPTSFQPYILGMPAEPVEEGERVNLRCTSSILSETQMEDVIAPTVEWIIPTALPRPIEGSSEYSFTVVTALNLATISCAFVYHNLGTSRKDTRSFYSEPISLQVTIDPFFQEKETRIEMDTATGSAILRCVFEANPRVDPKTTELTWTRTIVADLQTEVTDAKDKRMTDCGKRGQPGVRDEIIKPNQYSGFDIQYRKFGSKKNPRNLTFYSMAIRNFTSDKEGCYTCHLHTLNSKEVLHRSFNVARGTSDDTRHGQNFLPGVIAICGFAAFLFIAVIALCVIVKRSTPKKLASTKNQNQSRDRILMTSLSVSVSNQYDDSFQPNKIRMSNDSGAYESIYEPLENEREPSTPLYDQLPEPKKIKPTTHNVYSILLSDTYGYGRTEKRGQMTVLATYGKNDSPKMATKPDVVDLYDSQRTGDTCWKETTDQENSSGGITAYKCVL